MLVTIVVSTLIVGAVVMAVARLRSKGLCDCHSDCSACKGCHKSIN